MESLYKARSPQSDEDTYHGGDDAALLDEAYLLVEDRRGIAVEADDKPPVHLQAGPLDTFD